MKREIAELPKKWMICFFVLMSFAFLTLHRSADAKENPENRYLGMSLQQLMQVKITSVSKKEEKLSEAAAAVFVITGEDIRRSGVTNIPEALRMAPGVEVARIGSNKWAISIRGFNGRFANKLLVLLDGRSVYSPIFSGVFWDIQDLLLEDVDRIEVIRGPGATLWGANAVNGVINIITKHAKATQGVFLSAGGGDEEKRFGEFRFGGRMGSAAFFRVYGKAFLRDSFHELSGSGGIDEWSYRRSGFRLDVEPDMLDSFTFQGDVYKGSTHTRAIEPSLFPPYAIPQDTQGDSWGGNILGNWKHHFGDSSQMDFQSYWDRVHRGATDLSFTTDKFDLDLQYRFAVGERQEWTLGLGYRYTRNDTRPGPNTGFNPKTREDSLYSGFLQDEITLIPEKLHLTVGSKLEHNDYSGFEIQPSGRILWKIDETRTVWAAVSSAVRTPSRGEADARFASAVLPPGGLSPFPTLIVLEANEDFDSEKLLAYELGYRTRFAERLSLDFALFYNRYNDLRTLEPVSMAPAFFPTPVPHLEMDITNENNMGGEAHGFEVSANIKVKKWWRITPAFTYTRLSLQPDSKSMDTTAEDPEEDTPKYRVSIRSSMDLPLNLELDGWLRYVDDLAAQDVPAYTALDFRLGWRPFKNLDVSLVGSNLLDNRHPEFAPEIYGMVPSEVERSFYGKVTYHF